MELLSKPSWLTGYFNVKTSTIFQQPLTSLDAAGVESQRSKLPKERTSFLDLPAELRNEIYELALVHDSPFRLPCSVPTAILSTCKQINAEAGPMLYGANVFVFESWFDLRTQLLGLSASTVQMLRQVRLNERYYVARDQLCIFQSTLGASGRPLPRGVLHVRLADPWSRGMEEDREYWVTDCPDVLFVSEMGGKEFVATLRTGSATGSSPAGVSLSHTNETRGIKKDLIFKNPIMALIWRN